MDIRLTSDTENISWVELARVLELAPLGKKRDPEKLEIAFKNSMIKVFAFDGEKLVGTGRALSDGVWRAAIYDVAILPEYQNKGIGGKIVEYLVQNSGVDVIMLYANPGKEPFYKKFGFRKMKTAMAIMANTDECIEKGFIE